MKGQADNLTALERKLVQAQSNEVFLAKANETETWREDVSKYINEKTEFQGVPPPYVKITNKAIKAQETRYNPITQVYTDAKVEKDARKVEQEQFINVLAKNKDRALRYE